VFDPAVLDALARAARASEDHVARQALAKADPAVAWWLRRRVARAIRWASSCVADPWDRGHILRLAYLREARALGDLDFEDRPAVQASFDAAAARAVPAPRFWATSTILGGLVLVAALGAGAVAWHTAAFEPSSTPVGRVLGPDLTAYVVRASHLRAAQRAATSAAPPGTLDDDAPPPLEPLASPVLEPLSALLQAYRTSVLGPPCTGAGCGDDLSASTQRLNGALHAARQPYFVDFVFLSDGEPMLMSYYVARERTAKIEGAEVRLLRVQRLDELDKSLPVLGYTSPRLGAGLVTLDTIERDLVQVVMPALREDGLARLVDQASRDDGAPWAADVERSAGQALRRDYASYRSSDLDAVTALLARREDLYWELTGAIARTGASLARPRRLVSRDPLEALEGFVPLSSLRAWREVNASLDEAPMRDAFGVVLDRIADRIERHELQHQIDFRAGLVTLPADLAALIGVADPIVAPGGAAARCRDELSAELAAIATDPELAATMLTLSLGAVFDRGQWSTPYAYAGSVLLAAVAKELGVGPDDPRPIGLDRGRVTPLFVAVVSRPGKDIADAASQAYAHLFATSLPPLALGPWTTSPVWRR
jgi:hypothetical protein